MNNSLHTQGILFEAVQKAQVFPDSKTFVDCIPKKSISLIEDDYQKQKGDQDFDLSEFVKENFTVPEEIEHNLNIFSDMTMEEHVEYLWDVLTRKPDKQNNGSLIPLPYPYIVPGGRFREIYYWDSYFTSVGLAASNRLNIVENMVRNFAFLTEQYGHIPNGNRSYYLSRSQPPFFCSMLEILARHNGIEAIKDYLWHLEKEYSFLMADKEILSDKNRASRRVVLVRDNVILNRYWDEKDTPREESYREDIETAAKIEPENKNRFYRNIRAACESGWDFTSRWFADEKNLETIRTTDIIPIDLNSIIYNIENKLAEWFSQTGEKEKTIRYKALAELRKEAVNKYFWNEESGFFFDVIPNQSEIRQTEIWSLAGAYPLFFRIASGAQAEKIAKHIEKKFLYRGGLTTTLNETAQQWDKPNGWAPLHWIIIEGLMNYRFEDLARKIANRFVNLTRKVFTKTGKMMEKYNVCDMSPDAGGGEYPLQDGFGWTNGVTAALISKFNV
jgi:alpha,alpha-trehalase